MSTPNDGRVDQDNTHEEIEGNKNKRSTYLIRTVNCSCSKILTIIKVTKMILIIIMITIIIITIIMIITIIIKYGSRSRTLTITNTELPVTLYNDPKAANITRSSTSDTVWVLYTPLKQLIHHLT